MTIHCNYELALVGFGRPGRTPTQECQNGAHALLHFTTTGHRARFMVGSWEGKQELAILVEINHDEARANAVLAWARADGQDAVLFLGPMRPARRGRLAYLALLTSHAGQAFHVTDWNDAAAPNGETAEVIDGWSLDFLGDLDGPAAPVPLPHRKSSRHDHKPVIRSR